MGSREMPLTINAPMAVTSVTDRNSMPYAKVPDAAMTGLPPPARSMSLELRLRCPFQLIKYMDRIIRAR